jgi:TPR repeat protein/serine/threonine protein kinase
MKTVANLFAQTYARLGSDHQQDRHFIGLERFAPDEDNYCSFVKRVEGLAQNEYWVAREKNILMLLKRTPYVVRLRKEEKTNDSYQTIKTKDAGISLAHWLRTKPRLADSNATLKHPFVQAQSFLQLAYGALAALKEIHEAGVIHSQLRPDNVCIPYAPYPYQFDTSLNLDYSNVTLIDFMFAVSSTLKLSRYLPIAINPAASTQSALIKHALAADQQKRQADVIQRIDYSVDLYALGFILQQIFQQDLIYPQGLEAKLSMGIHHIVTQLLSYDEGIPENVKIRYLHLQPHKDYLQEIDNLIQLCQKNAASINTNLLFDPAQFLEDGSVFHLDEPIIDIDTLANIEPSQEELTPAPVAAATSSNLDMPLETKTMKDTSTRAELNQAESHIEISKITVILLIISLQVLYVIYTEGQNMGLDVVASMGLVVTIGIALALANKLFTPPKPLPKSSPLIIESNHSNVALSTEETSPIMSHKDETPTEQVAVSSVSIENPQKPEPQVPKEEKKDVAPPVVLLKTATNTPIKTESAPIEMNKWLVIAIIIALQLGYIWYTTDLKGKPTEAVVDAPVENTEPVEAVMPETDPLVAEAVPVEEIMPDTGSAVANIELLSEASSVKTPEIATPKPKKVKTSESENTDSVLLSGSPVNEAKTKKEKPVAAVKEPVAQGQTAIPLTNEQAKAADKTPTTNTTSAEETLVAANNNVATTNAATANTAKKEAEKPTPKSLTRGLAEAQNTMGWHYYHGDGVAKNYEESFKWFQKAANLGESSAQFNVGMMYASGTGVKQDLTEAAKWYKKSAEQGKASAQLNLGMMYISGRGIRQNIDEGKKWLTKAAEQGDVTAKANLAWLSQQGYIKSDAPSNEADKAE